MSTINILVQEHEAFITDSPVISAQGIKADTVSFTFDASWSQAEKYATFYREETPGEVWEAALDANGSCNIPAAVLSGRGHIFIGVYGLIDDGQSGTIVYTSEEVKYKILPGLYGTEFLSPSEESEGTKYTHLLSVIADLKSNIGTAYAGIKAALEDTDILTAIAVLDQAILDLSEIQ